jgi:transglutaminase-like putative cysteine protease
VHYHISHNTRYIYNQAVYLKPHLVRLRPRCDGWQKLLNFSLSVTPEPAGVWQIRDLEGNDVIQLWFTQATEQLLIEMRAEVETYQENPFNYLLEPWALKLPIDYPSSLASLLAPYLNPYSVIHDPVAAHLARDIAHQVHGETLSFLATLNQHLYDNCDYIVRATGEPWQAGITWNTNQGSCRDLAVLFMDVCRAVGLAARFVSGYQEGDLDQEERDLHAWAEVYLPGGGWCGYDPTHGLAVSDRHIPLVASALPAHAAPIVGQIVPARSVLETGKPAESLMEAHISIRQKGKG